MASLTNKAATIGDTYYLEFVVNSGSVSGKLQIEKGSDGEEVVRKRFIRLPSREGGAKVFERELIGFDREAEQLLRQLKDYLSRGTREEEVGSDKGYIGHEGVPKGDDGYEFLDW